jgi:hypothetical protein
VCHGMLGLRSQQKGDARIRIRICVEAVELTCLQRDPTPKFVDVSNKQVQDCIQVNGVVVYVGDCVYLKQVIASEVINRPIYMLNHLQDSFNFSVRAKKADESAEEECDERFEVTLLCEFLRLTSIRIQKHTRSFIVRH